MKRTTVFVRSVGRVRCRLNTGEDIDVPVAPGILKHPTMEELVRLLAEPAAMRKYTLEALRIAPWSILREFPVAWLVECLAQAAVTEPRRRALEFMLGLPLGGGGP